MRGKSIIGTVFGDILLQHRNINRKNMSWNKRDGTKLRALMYISDCTEQNVLVSLWPAVHDSSLHRSDRVGMDGSA